VYIHPGKFIEKELDIVRHGVTQVEVYEHKDSLLIINRLDSLVIENQLK
jgi:hypothetical protein